MSYNLRGGWEYSTVLRSGAGSVQVAAGVAGETIVVLSMWGVTNPGTTGVHTLQSETNSVVIARFSAALLTAGNGYPINIPYSPIGWCETADGDDLDLVVFSEGVCLLNVVFIRKRV